MLDNVEDMRLMTNRKKYKQFLRQIFAICFIANYLSVRSNNDKLHTYLYTHASVVRQ